MIALFNLIKSLSKEEKRLYTTYGSPTRFKNIYQNYLKAEAFSKALDAEIYSNFYSDTTKAYYSMQKKELYEDILAVLLEHSNPQNPFYNYYKAIAKIGILLERNLPDDAKEYAQTLKLNPEKFSSAHINLYNELLFSAFEASQNASFLDFIQFLESTPSSWDYQRTILLKIKLLNINLDGLDIEKIQNFASQVYQEIKNIPEPNYSLKMASIQALNLKQDFLSAHKELTNIYMSHYKDILDQKEALDCLTMLMNSCLKNGDFLLLNSIIYKTQSKINTIPENLKLNFLLPYYENTSLFHFYENDLPAALKEIQFVIDNSPVTELIEKAICYKMAMLVAGDLQYQLTNELNEYATKYPFIIQNPYIIICDILASINNQINKNELITKIENLIQIAKKNNQKNILTIAKMLSEFIYKRKFTIEENIRVFPPEWEPILAVNLWIKAKIERIFYYNLITEEWLKRRKVF